MHAYIHTYSHTYIHTYIHTCTAHTLTNHCAYTNLRRAPFPPQNAAAGSNRGGSDGDGDGDGDGYDRRKGGRSAAGDEDGFEDDLQNRGGSEGGRRAEKEPVLDKYGRIVISSDLLVRCFVACCAHVGDTLSTVVWSG